MSPWKAAGINVILPSMIEPPQEAIEGYGMGHTYTNILVHVIFSTKDRVQSLADDLRPRLYEYMAGVARHEFGRALDIGGTADHVHGVLSLGSDVSVAEALRKWKSLSSGWIHQTFPQYASFAWQPGYGAFSVSQSALADVRAYIARQAEHHQRVSFEDELRAFLDRNGIPYDPVQMLG